MEQEITLSSNGEAKEESFFMRNCHIPDLLELCVQPKGRKEMRNLLETFWSKFDQCFLESKYYKIFNAFGMYVFDYVYTHHGVTFSSFTKAFNAYILQMKSAYFIDLLNEDDYVRNVRHFDFQNRPRLFEIPLHTCMEQGFLGLAQFLVKFGLNEFIFEPELKISKLAKMFRNRCELISLFSSNALNTEDLSKNMKVYIVTEYVNLDTQHNPEIENLIEMAKRKKLGRSILIFCTISIISDYKVHEILDLKQFTEVCRRKLKCLHLVTATTTEPWITLNDIEKFFATFYPSLNDSIRKCFQETFKTIFPDASHFANPRSLIDLCRCEIRACLLSTSMLPKQVHQLPIPIFLKNFILFDCGNIWDCLKQDQVNIYLRYENFYIRIKELRNNLYRLKQFVF